MIKSFTVLYTSYKLGFMMVNKINSGHSPLTPCLPEYSSGALLPTEIWQQIFLKCNVGTIFHGKLACRNLNSILFNDEGFNRRFLSIAPESNTLCSNKINGFLKILDIAKKTNHVEDLQALSGWNMRDWRFSDYQIISPILEELFGQNHFSASLTKLNLSQNHYPRVYYRLGINPKSLFHIRHLSFSPYLFNSFAHSLSQFSALKRLDILYKERESSRPQYDLGELQRLTHLRELNVEFLIFEFDLTAQIKEFDALFKITQITHLGLKKERSWEVLPLSNMSQSTRLISLVCNTPIEVDFHFPSLKLIQGTLLQHGSSLLLPNLEVYSCFYYTKSLRQLTSISYLEITDQHVDQWDEKVVPSLDNLTHLKEINLRCGRHPDKMKAFLETCNQRKINITTFGDYISRFSLAHAQ